MAAPAHKTLQNLAGNWLRNDTLSDDPTPALKLQGVNYFVRKAATSAAVQLAVTQSADSNHVTMKHYATSFKIAGSAEEYLLDWKWREWNDQLFGALKGRSRWVDVEEAREEGEWTDEGQIVQAEGNKVDGAWMGTHFWGFEIVGGERRHVRRTRIWKESGEEVRMRMVYDFKGE